MLLLISAVVCPSVHVEPRLRDSCHLWYCEIKPTSVFGFRLKGRNHVDATCEILKKHKQHSLVLFQNMAAIPESFRLSLAMVELANQGNSAATTEWQCYAGCSYDPHTRQLAFVNVDQCAVEA